MMKCINCGNEMVIGYLHGEPFTIDLDHEINDFTVRIPTNEKEKNIFGFEYNKNIELPLNVKVCLKCGKVDFHVNINK